MISPVFRRLFDRPDCRAYRDLTVVEPAALPGWLGVVSGIAALDSWRGQPSCHLGQVVSLAA